MLEISPSASEEAAVQVACLLQRIYHSISGGHLRELTRKAGEGEFSPGPILMAQITPEMPEAIRLKT
jgi:replication initiation protein RepC